MNLLSCFSDMSSVMIHSLTHTAPKALTHSITHIAPKALSETSKSAMKVGTKLGTAVGAGLAGCAVYNYSAPKIIDSVSEDASEKEKKKYIMKHTALRSTCVVGTELIGKSVYDTMNSYIDTL